MTALTIGKNGFTLPLERVTARHNEACQSSDETLSYGLEVIRGKSA